MKLIDFFKLYPDEQSCKDSFREQRQKGLSVKEMQRQLGRKRYEPVWFMMHKIRVAMGARDERYELSGFTEMDEGFFTTVKSATVGEKNKKVKRGRGSEKQSPVLVMAETEKARDPKTQRLSSRCKYFKMRVMPDLTSKTINNIVRDCLSYEIKVKTDSYSSYNKLNEVIKKHVSQVIPSDQAGIELPWVHMAISNAKRDLLNNFHHVDDIYLQNYPNEFTYRLNRRYFSEILIGRLLIASISYCWII